MNIRKAVVTAAGRGQQAPPLQNFEDRDCIEKAALAQNVGPILELVTEKYLLRSDAEWASRQQALGSFENLREPLRACDVRALGARTTLNFELPIQTIIPWASNFYTEMLIDHCRSHFGYDFCGFLMLGAMSGGGMGFLVAPGPNRHFL